MSAVPFHSEAGLTLIELLVALTVMALVTVMAAQGLHTGLRAWEGGVSHTEQTRHTELVRSYLRDLLRNIYPLYRSDARRPAIWFKGSEDEVVFLAAGPRRLATEGFKRFRLHRVRAGSDATLRLSWCALWGKTPEDPCTDQEHHEDLITGLKTVKLGYGAASDKMWRDGDRLPDLISLQLSFADGRAWPPFLVRPRIEQDTACQFDIVARRCRGR